jgi:asparagine synthetase B (glutamine-hydrolysing)
MLGHTRLKVIDINKRSDQPMEVEYFFNGDMCRYLELATELGVYLI